MDVVDLEVGALLAVLKAWAAGVHDADIVEVGPERGGGGEVFCCYETDEVVLGGGVSLGTRYSFFL